MGKIQLAHKFEDIISLENLFLAWREFLPGKKKKKDVQEFSHNLADNILALHEDLANKTYCHGGYESFYVNDPKRRHIHKAAVRDRLLHHAVYRILYPFFEKTFIADSYSCRLGKGTHRALERFRAVIFDVSKNHTRTAWALKCDIKKFFASIDHGVLLEILKEYIPDENVIWLLENIIGSFSVCPLTPTLSPKGRGDNRGVGLPLGNLTSQLFANVYMNVFDHWVKHKLNGIKDCPFGQGQSLAYLRYADDFVFLSENREWLLKIIPRVRKFLVEELKLTLHPDKIFLKTIYSGIDFLGWKHFPRHRVMRGTTKRRMFKRIKGKPTPEALQSYLGLLKHGNTFKVVEKLLMKYWLLKNT